MTGSSDAANFAAASVCALRPADAAPAGLLRFPQLCAALLVSGEGGASAFRNLSPLLLGKSSIEVQHEWICVGPQFGDDERHTLGHQPGNKRHVTRETIELGHQD